MGRRKKENPKRHLDVIKAGLKAKINFMEDEGIGFNQTILEQNDIRSDKHKKPGPVEKGPADKVLKSEHDTDFSSKYEEDVVKGSKGKKPIHDEDAMPDLTKFLREIYEDDISEMDTGMKEELKSIFEEVDNEIMGTDDAAIQEGNKEDSGANSGPGPDMEEEFNKYLRNKTDPFADLDEGFRNYMRMLEQDMGDDIDEASEEEVADLSEAEKEDFDSAKDEFEGFLSEGEMDLKPEDMQKATMTGVAADDTDSYRNLINDIESYLTEQEEAEMGEAGMDETAVSPEVAPETSMDEPDEQALEARVSALEDEEASEDEEVDEEDITPPDAEPSLDEADIMNFLSDL